ncbi:MAG: dihydrodipicolinate synthase family protein [Planctomycetes bacterium]|nr:dihydrodipicolinate synthase family protein [Planctomycetota bacterium]
MDHQPLRGLVAAPHTPFDSAGNLLLEVVERQAEALRREGVGAAFVGGSTGEFASLTHDERDVLAKRWLEVGRSVGLRVIVHVGGTAVEAGAELARRARAAGAETIAALAPFYHRPRDADELLACCRTYAAGAPDAAFYYYDIPALTGITVSLVEFATRARQQIPSLVGIKHTSSDLVALQQCLAIDGLDVLHGNDETLLAGLALGVRGAVGSTYNLAPGVYLRLAAAFARGDLDAARQEQRRSIALVHTLAARGYMAAAKATMVELGIDIGPPRLPHAGLDAAARAALREELQAIGFFDWRTADELAACGGADW